MRDICQRCQNTANGLISAFFIIITALWVNICIVLSGFGRSHDTFIVEIYRPTGDDIPISSQRLLIQKQTKVDLFNQLNRLPTGSQSWAGNSLLSYLRTIIVDTTVSHMLSWLDTCWVRRSMCILSGLRSAETAQYIKSRCHTEIGKRAFLYAGPLAWNDLRLSLHCITDSKRFRKHL